MEKKYNKLSIIAISLIPISFYSLEKRYLTTTMFLIIVSISVILGIISLLQIRKTGEKGKIFAMFPIAIVIFYSIGTYLLSLLIDFGR